MSADRYELVSRLRAMAIDRRWSEVASEIDGNGEIDNERATLLLAELSEFGGVDWLAPLLRRGANINGKSGWGITALGNCIVGAHHRYPTLDLFIELLASGADPDLPSRDGSTALQMAIEESKLEYAVVLLLWGADVGGGHPPGSSYDAQLSANQAGRGWAKDLLRRWRAGNQSDIRKRCGTSTSPASRTT
jgi:hypothetical protein